MDDDVAGLAVDGGDDAIGADRIGELLGKVVL